MLKFRKINSQNKQSVLSVYKKIYLRGNTHQVLSQLMDKTCHIGFCGYNDANLVGFISASHALNEIDIIELGVMSEFRRQGVAFELIIHLQRYCIKQNIRRIFLEVAKNNVPAIRLYEKAGFNEIGIRKNYYSSRGSPVDAFVYRWSSV